MMIRRTPHPSCRQAGLLAAGVLLLAAALTGCQDPQEPAPAATGIPGSYDATNQTFAFGVESTTGAFSTLRLVGSDVRFDAETQRVHAMVSLRNEGNVELPGPHSLTVFDFVPATVAPVNAATCAAATGNTPNAGACMYVLAGTYGDDDVLSPDEVSTPIEWIFHDPSGESFAFRVRLSSQRDSFIGGIVFEDLNGNGQHDPEEPARVDAEVVLEEDTGRRTARTDSAGLYGFPVEHAGLYRVDLTPAFGWRITTAHPIEVLIVERPDGTLSSFNRAHFGCQRQNAQVEIPVAGIVFEDLNRNGHYDSVEPGIPGVEIYGAALQCPTFAAIRTVTGPDGRYSLLLPPCPPPYEVSRVEVPGYVGTTPNLVIFRQPPVAGTALQANFGVAAPTDSTCIQSPAQLIQKLAHAYEAMDLARYRELLANVPEANAEFLFILPEPNGLGETQWGFIEEARIHWRMFDPDSIPLGEPPVPPELWAQSIHVTLVPLEEFSERPDLYTSNGGLLDPARWRAMSARYATDVFWDLAGSIDYHVAGGANFVVIEDLTKRACDPGHFLVLFWEDLGPASDPAGAVETMTWAGVKSLYR